ncbi:MAG: hypothetical protein M1820_003506 [Bogoriella megaspora]|nr:MAG: hypothetical protein M1820_003506 [Bogoriella megaspora]
MQSPRANRQPSADALYRQISSSPAAIFGSLADSPRPQTYRRSQTQDSKAYDSEQHEKLNGKTEAPSKKQRSFLQRNLRLVVDRHRREEEAMRKRKSRVALAASSLRNVGSKIQQLNGSVQHRTSQDKPNPSQNKTWQFPGKSDLDRCVAGSAILAVDFCSIAPVGVQASSSNWQHPLSTEDEILLWEIPCTLGCSITKVGKKWPKELLHRGSLETQKTDGILRCTVRGKDRIVYIETNHSLSWDTSAFLTRKNYKDLHLDFYVICLSDDDTDLLIDAIKGHKVDHNKEKRKSESGFRHTHMFKSSWEGTSHEFGSYDSGRELEAQLLQWRPDKGDKGEWANINHFLRAETRFTARVTPPLARHNAALRLRSPQQQKRSVGETATSEEPIVESVQISYRVKGYVHEASDDHEGLTEGYECHLCRSRKFASFHLLHLHFYLDHNDLRVKATRTNRTESGRNMTEVKVLVDDAPNGNDEANPVIPQNGNQELWIRPRKPLQFDGWLGGDFEGGYKNWLKSGWSTRRRSQTMQDGSIQSVNAGSLQISDEFGSALPSLVLRTCGQILDGMSEERQLRTDENLSIGIAFRAKAKHPSDVVRKLPSPRRKRHSVPHGPENVTFYQTNTKFPYKEGDEALESDDEIDESWLLMQKNEALDSLLQEQPNSMKEFIKILDAHMIAERLHGDIYVGDAIVRFTIREEKLLLLRPDLAQQLVKKVIELREDAIINTAVADYCFEFASDIRKLHAFAKSFANTQATEQQVIDFIMGAAYTAACRNGPYFLARDEIEDFLDDLQYAGSTDLQDSANVIVATDEEGDIQMLDGGVNGNSAPNGRGETMPDYGRCICGEPVQVFRDAITCTNKVCPRLEYHLKCVGLQKRIPGWKCSLCTT